MADEASLTGAAPPSDASGGDTRSDVARLEAEVERFKELAARAQADVQNVRARAQRDGEDMRRYAAADLLSRLLPTVDNVTRALQQVPAELATHEWIKGIAAIEQEMLRVLAEAGLARMQSLGQPVDPERHEVLMTGPGAKGTVIQVFDEGYELHGKVLRPAKVKAGDGKNE